MAGPANHRKSGTAPQDRRHGPFAPCPIPPSMGQLMGISLKLATWPIFWEIPQSFHNFIQPFPRAEIFLGEKSLPLPPDVPHQSEKHRGIRIKSSFLLLLKKKTKIPPKTPLEDHTI